LLVGTGLVVQIRNDPFAERAVEVLVGEDDFFVFNSEVETVSQEGDLAGDQFTLVDTVGAAVSPGLLDLQVNTRTDEDFQVHG